MNAATMWRYLSVVAVAAAAPKRRGGTEEWRKQSQIFSDLHSRCPELLTCSDAPFPRSDFFTHDDQYSTDYVTAVFAFT